MERLQFRSGVQCAEFCRAGDIDQLRLDSVFGRRVGQMSFHGLCHLSGCDLSVPVGETQYLVTGGLHSPCLVDVDVSAGCADRSLIWAQSGVNHCQIRLRSSYDEVYGSVLLTAEFPENRRCLCTVCVFPVSDGLFKICLCKFF